LTYGLEGGAFDWRSAGVGGWCAEDCCWARGCENEGDEFGVMHSEGLGNGCAIFLVFGKLVNGFDWFS
jgi:hypothetical protein